MLLLHTCDYSVPCLISLAESHVARCVNAVLDCEKQGVEALAAAHCSQSIRPRKPERILIPIPMQINMLTRDPQIIVSHLHLISIIRILTSHHTTHRSSNNTKTRLKLPHRHLLLLPLLPALLNSESLIEDILVCNSTAVAPLGHPGLT